MSIKIKLEQWKEVIRLEFIEGILSSCRHEDGSSGIKIAGREFYYLIDYDNNTFIFSALHFAYSDFRKAIYEHNNSIQDDGYLYECNVCGESECKTKTDLTNCNYDNPCMFGMLPEWQPISNNKIEIIEDDKE